MVSDRNAMIASNNSCIGTKIKILRGTPVHVRFTPESGH